MLKSKPLNRLYPLCKNYLIILVSDAINILKHLLGACDNSYKIHKTKFLVFVRGKKQ